MDHRAGSAVRDGRASVVTSGNNIFVLRHERPLLCHVNE
jgi:hypothetical protein